MSPSLRYLAVLLVQHDQAPEREALAEAIFAIRRAEWTPAWRDPGPSTARGVGDRMKRAQWQARRRAAQQEVA